MADLVIRNGTVVDGTGGPARRADVAIENGRIVAVGTVPETGTREIDATGLIVTPGFVDIHTHYDGQATWDPYLTPSSWHGVTTVVMGNCGVGFAPAAPDRHDWVIQLMEGVEDIPGAALAEGIDWQWESFPEYLDALEKMPRAVDVGTQVPHGAVRAYVMGERGAKNEEATDADIEAMGRIVTEGVAAGALGFTTSRTILHRAKDGEPVPGTFADRQELVGIGRAMAKGSPRAVFEMASDIRDADDEFSWMSELSRETGVAVTYALVQNPLDPEGWRGLIKRTEDAVAEGADISAQIACRGAGLVLGWDSTVHPFMNHPAYEEVHHLAIDDRVVALRDPERRRRLIEEDPPRMTGSTAALSQLLVSGYNRMFLLEDSDGTLDYEPAPEASLAARAEAAGRPPRELVYDALMENDGRGYVFMPLLNYANFDLDHVRELFDHPNTVLSLSDGGAHCGLICDASFPTFMLTHWARDRSRGEKITLERAVRMQTRDTAVRYGLEDRGVLGAGYKADVNVIDYDALQIDAPAMVADLPAGGKRLVQTAQGYRYTIVSGEITVANGEFTGAMPGALVRGAQPSPT